MVLLDNIDRDNYLNTADSLEFPEAINLNQGSFKIYHQSINLNGNILSQMLTHSVCSFGT
jgi:hypothetical protein